VDPIVGLYDVEKRKFLILPGLELQPVPVRYNDYAIPAPAVYRIKELIKRSSPSKGL
jgi:hypothetical protein